MGYFNEEEEEEKRERFNMGGFSTNNFKGFILALLSSGFIGASFIIKKKGLRRAAAVSGVRAGEFSCVFSILSSFDFFLFEMGFWFSQLGMCLIA